MAVSAVPVYSGYVNAPSEDRLVTDEGARQIELTLDRQMGSSFNLLCEDLAENGLLGEILRANDDAILPRRSAGYEEK